MRLLRNLLAGMKTDGELTRVIGLGAKTVANMVSDERRAQLNLEYFRGQVQQQWQAYNIPRPAPWQQLWRNRLALAAASVEALLPSGSRILDVGCGSGELSLRLAKAGYHVTAVDIVEEMLDLGRRSDSDVQWLRAPFSDRVAAKGSFDAVLALGYLEFQERAGKELVRMGRLLKPGGLLILSVPNTLSQQFGFGIKRAIFRLGKEPEASRIRHSFTPERLQRCLGMAGFIFLDYQWLSEQVDEQPLSLSRERAFWKHRVRDRLQPEMLTLSRTYRPDDTAVAETV